MAAELVIGSLLSASFDFLLEKIASPYVEEFFFKGNKSCVSERLFKLKSTFNCLAAVRFEVENKKIKNPVVEKWLDDLLDAVDDAEDFFGDIQYDAMKSKITEAETERRKVRKLFNFSNPFNSVQRIRNNNMEEILQRLELLANQIGNMNLENNVVEVKPSEMLFVKTSPPDEPEVYGRENDKDALMKSLTSDKFDVIPIVGMGGIGKTTLAQTLFNDEEVTKMFELKVWVYVSDKFDAMAVTKTILQQVALDDARNDMDLNLLQVNLAKKLMGKKFLIVLDDAWADDYVQWKEVMKPFKDGAKGSKIVVTTRNKTVADSIGTVDSHYLKQLSKDECWQLFAKHASRGNLDMFIENPRLESIGREVVKKCNGLPLAAKVLGGLLRSTLDAKRWEQIAKSNIWELTDKGSKILPAALEVSYHYLPAHLKKCFAYCSIFPKGYRFQRQELVLIWMAENLVKHSEGNRRMEEVGDEYFDELVSMSFFQLRTYFNNEPYFVMHDLIVDLARAVSGKYCYLLEHNEYIDEFEKKTRHLGCATEVLCFGDKIYTYDFKATRLRTLLSVRSGFGFGFGDTLVPKEVVHNLLPKLKCLKVLSFRGCGITDLADSIGDLKYLRYLDLSGTKIVMLPESVTVLYNLQTLKLEKCYLLETLPKDMHHLINLRHLIISHASLAKMPSQISKLRNLQMLTTFAVGKDSGAKIEELAKLSSLRGELSIEKLENVANITKASDQVNVLNKKQLEKLSLVWTAGDVDPKHGESVLEMLSPNTTLKQIEILGYPGTKFPNWIGDDSFSNIVDIELSGSRHCSNLPPLGQLPSLKILHISSFHSVTTVGAEFYGNSSVKKKPFSSLETLSFSSMSSWEQWHSMQTEDAATYGKLKTLEIYNCPKLIGDLPRFLPSLTKIEIDADKQCALNIPRLPCVTEMSITKLENMESLYEALKAMNPSSSTGSLLTTLTPLQSLTLSCCGSSFRSFHMDLFPTLRTLEIRNCHYFEALSMSDGQYRELTSLTIFKCRSFVSFPNGGLIAPKLSDLNINYCPKLKWLPEKMISLSSLKSLEMRGCPLVETIPEGGLPISLSTLEINYHQLLRIKWNWQTLPNLRNVTIGGYKEDLESFPEEGLLPATITSLTIHRFSKLRGLDKNGLSQLTSLQQLTIRWCPELQTLSEEGFPTSLSSLEIRYCPLLKKIYDTKDSENKEYWRKISHIPNVKFY